MFSACRTLVCVVLLVALSVSGAYADFIYKDKSKVDGALFSGPMKAIVKMSGQSLDNIASTHYLKGNKMRTETPANNSVEIIDLDKEAFISINTKKKTYSVLTFAELRRQMEEAMQKMKESGKKDDSTELEPKVSIKKSGKTRSIAGYPTEEVLVTIALEAKDKKSGDTATLEVNSNLWLASGVSGYREVVDFQRRFTEKLGTPRMMGMLQAFMNDARMVEGLKEAQKEQSKLDGLALLTVVSMGVGGTAQAQAGSSQTQTRQKEEEEESSIPSVSKSVGKIFGGFGRKKKEEKKDEQSASGSEAAASSDAAGTTALMRITTEVTEISTAPVSGSLFEVPSDYKQVDRK